MTNNKDLGDRLINGLMGTVMHIHGVRNNNKATGIIFIKFDDPKSWKQVLKDRRLRGDLKGVELLVKCIHVNDYGGDAADLFRAINDDYLVDYKIPE